MPSGDPPALGFGRALSAPPLWLGPRPMSLPVLHGVVIYPYHAACRLRLWAPATRPLPSPWPLLLRVPWAPDVWILRLFCDPALTTVDRRGSFCLVPWSGTSSPWSHLSPAGEAWQTLAKWKTKEAWGLRAPTSTPNKGRREVRLCVPRGSPSPVGLCTARCS